MLDQIRLLSNCKRIIENLMYKRLSNFLNFNTLIYILQSVTLKNTQLLMVWLILANYMWQTQYEGSSACGVFVDLQKTFNTVDPKILLHKVYEHCKVHYFADNRNNFHTGYSVASLNKPVNCNMKRFNNWLSANKVSLNVEKTELVIFKSPRKVLCDVIKIKLDGKRLYPCNTVKYCGVKVKDSYTGIVNEWHCS